MLSTIKFHLLQSACKRKKGEIPWATPSSQHKLGKNVYAGATEFHIKILQSAATFHTNIILSHKWTPCDGVGWPSRPTLYANSST